METVYNHCSLVQLEKKSINWQVVYKDWLQWLSLRSWRYVARCVFTAENRKESITCFRMSGNCVITGHPNGSIKLWDRYKCFLGEINSHLRDVTDLDLMKYEGKSWFLFYFSDFRYVLIVLVIWLKTKNVTCSFSCASLVEGFHSPRNAVCFCAKWVAM